MNRTKAAIRAENMSGLFRDIEANRIKTAQINQLVTLTRKMFVYAKIQNKNKQQIDKFNKLKTDVGY